MAFGCFKSISSWSCDLYSLRGIWRALTHRVHWWVGAATSASTTRLQPSRLQHVSCTRYLLHTCICIQSRIKRATWISCWWPGVARGQKYVQPYCVNPATERGSDGWTGPSAVLVPASGWRLTFRRPYKESHGANQSNAVRWCR